MELVRPCADRPVDRPAPRCGRWVPGRILGAELTTPPRSQSSVHWSRSQRGTAASNLEEQRHTGGAQEERRRPSGPQSSDAHPP